MKIEKIEWRNFGSYGNKISSIQFNDRNSLILVGGANGNGKSLISDVIIYTLYGKLDGKKLKDIPNRKNKSAWSKITFTANGNIYEVERGLEPSIFELYTNGTPYDKAGKVPVQD